jgi:hypothetical protein
MLRRLIGVLTAGWYLAACGSNQPQLAERSRGEAGHLQEYARRAGLNNAETQRADASLASAAKYHADGDEDEAAAASDLAATLYRLALAHKELADVQSDVALLKQGLAKDKDLLQTYQEILSEMKSVRKP